MPNEEDTNFLRIGALPIHSYDASQLILVTYNSRFDADLFLNVLKRFYQAIDAFHVYLHVSYSYLSDHELKQYCLLQLDNIIFLQENHSFSKKYVAAKIYGYPKF